MKYNDLQNILSKDRFSRYLLACNNDKRKALILYRLNLRLSQEIYAILLYFEIDIRNSIDEKLKINLGCNWLRDSISQGGIFDIKSCRDSAKIISKAYLRLKRNRTYSLSKLIAEMEFGIWKYMFANPQYRATARVLLNVFPNKPKSTAQKQYNNTYFFNALDGINILRNRVANHEPICFGLRQNTIDTSYIRNAYADILSLFSWMGIDGKSLLYGLDHVLNVCDKIGQL
ncbi:MAG: Abi family protein [Muribaculaceae bacterium]|nr:Abi family protein [Muribaculaceae bacterium]